MRAAMPRLLRSAAGAAVWKALKSIACSNSESYAQWRALKFYRMGRRNLGRPLEPHDIPAPEPINPSDDRWQRMVRRQRLSL